jgi:cyclic beta-1,2-glucan synthetase
MWAILAFAKSGAGDKAHDLFSLLNPINHAGTPEQTELYKVEPYVVAADVYSVAPHRGRGGWTWYTGSAAWMYRSGIEGILGIRREGAFLIVEPSIPSAWPGFTAAVRIGSTRYEISVDNSMPSRSGTWRAVLDDALVERCNGGVRVPIDGGAHKLTLDRK